MEDIKFSREELTLLKSKEFFPMKYTITQKIHQLFCETEKELKNVVDTSDFDYPVNALIKAGKISKGENYNYFPYMVLDFPRLFSREDLFALRTIFWWSHYFSNVFILGGKSLDLYREKISAKSGFLKSKSWHICIHPTPWRLELQPDNYIDLVSIEADKLEKIILQKKFIKVAYIYPITEYKDLKEKSTTFLKEILDLLG